MRLAEGADSVWEQPVPNLGNAWHIPANPEPRGRGGMPSPVVAPVAGGAVSILNGNQFRGAGNPGNQLGAGSSVFWRQAGEADWTEVPMSFDREVGDNKYFAATIPPTAGEAGDRVEYYVRVAYDDHDTTYLHAADDASAVTAEEPVARAAPVGYTLESPAVRGRWSETFPLPNVGIHAHLLSNGLVLMWGRRDDPARSLDEHACTPFLWDWRTGGVTTTPSPTAADGSSVNLFCAGHSYLPDGRLFVAGGHLVDGDGISQSCVYDPRAGTWRTLPPMTTPAGLEVRRWYPTCVTLADGRVLVMSGSYVDGTRPPGLQFQVVDLLQVWDGRRWGTLATADGSPLNYVGLPLYPRLHLADGEHVFLSGTIDRTQLLKVSAPAGWADVGLRALGNRDYCPAVMFDAGRILYVGGGGGNGGPPTAGAEVIDLSTPAPAWRPTAPMHHARRQHDATVLPDGSVLVTGGTRGGGFNDLDAGQPVHVAERWDPASEAWVELAAESVDRCYHSTALLMPDATVLSAGGGEFHAEDGQPNDPRDSHRDAQIFSPPYLFAGPRPSIAGAPDAVAYGTTFDVVTPDAASIAKVSLVRPGSITHAFDENQRLVFLPFSAGAGRLSVTAPATAASSPPGPHLLFLVSTIGVPSVAAFVQLGAAAADAGPAGAAALADAAAPVVTAESPRLGVGAFLPLHAYEADLEARPKGTPVTVGITPTCPYGIGACWGGAHEALGRLSGVEFVQPVPDSAASTALVHLRGPGLPPLRRWSAEFEAILNGTYVLRGVEASVEGRLETVDGALALRAATERPTVRLRPMDRASRVERDPATRAAPPLTPAEAGAYARLAAETGGTAATLVVTGPLIETAEGYELMVRHVDRR